MVFSERLCVMFGSEIPTKVLGLIRVLARFC